ncbi:hypothetical protein EVAR_61787_1 [Eumeta japonica]|uniref:Uncharacterized protein n=1 Tax=Eumeta variegata TaxID=151549 RepID=A0A4C1Z3F8_EUMVA|nr:hypothetical protein EVAR_61787_1 [Eumeta japonica]
MNKQSGLGIHYRSRAREQLAAVTGCAGTGGRSWRRRHGPQAQQRRASALGRSSEARTPVPQSISVHRLPSSTFARQKGGRQLTNGGVLAKISKYL